MLLGSALSGFEFFDHGLVLPLRAKGKPVHFFELSDSAVDENLYRLGFSFPGNKIRLITLIGTPPCRTNSS